MSNKLSNFILTKVVVLLQCMVFFGACSKLVGTSSLTNTSSKAHSVDSAQEDRNLQPCFDPDLSKVLDTTEIMLCDGTLASGQLSLADLTIDNVRSGVTIAGVAGSYKGDPPNPWDIRFGVEANGVSGLLKTACRDMADLVTFDNSTAPAVAGLDIFDTVDDYNNTAPIPTENPFGSEAFLCGDARVALTGASSNWLEIGQGSDVIWRDLISNIELSTVRPGTFTWQQALEVCDNLTHAGLDSWRLITAKELASVVRNGLWDLEGSSIGSLSTEVYWFWTASTLSQNNSMKWGGTAAAGARLTGVDLSEAHKVICVRDQD